MNLEEDRKLYKESDKAPGWEAIDSQVREVYSDQEPKHWGTVIGHILGGPDPIDGISAYECRDGGVDHLHYLTYGYTSLYYDEEAVGGEYSRFGFEMTLRLASPLPPEEGSPWVWNLLQNLARYVFDYEKWFANYHWIPANGPIRADYPTDLVGFAFLDDPTLAAIDSPHGRVEFIQAFGITQSEVDALMEGRRTCEEIVETHRAMNPLLVTDLGRKDE